MALEENVSLPRGESGLYPKHCFVLFLIPPPESSLQDIQTQNRAEGSLESRVGSSTLKFQEQRKLQKLGHASVFSDLEVVS